MEKYCKCKRALSPKAEGLAARKRLAHIYITWVRKQGKEPEINKLMSLYVVPERIARGLLREPDQID